MGFKKADAQESIEGRDEVRSGSPMFKPESGKGDKFKTTWLRFLPPRDDHPNNKFYLWTKVHFRVGPNDRTVFCSAMNDNECLVCAEVARLRREGLQDESEELAAKVTGLVNVVEVDEDSVPTGKISVWSMPKGTLIDLLNKIDDKLDEDERDISDPETGRDVWVNRKGTKLENTRYEVGVAENSTVFNQGDFGILDDGLHDLTLVNPELPIEKVAGLLTGGGRHRDPFEDDEPEEAVDGEVREIPDEPAPARAALPAGRRTAAAPAARTGGRGGGPGAAPPRGANGRSAPRRTSAEDVAATKARLQAAVATASEPEPED